MAHPLFSPKKPGTPAGLEGQTIVGFGELMPAGFTGPVTLVLLTQKFKTTGVFDYFVTLVVPVVSRDGGEIEVDHNIFTAPTLQRCIALAYNNQCLPFEEANEYDYSPVLSTT